MSPNNLRLYHSPASPNARRVALEYRGELCLRGLLGRKRIDVEAVPTSEFPSCLLPRPEGPPGCLARLRRGEQHQQVFFKPQHRATYNFVNA
jgi:hypothetical protein